ncbi:MAG: SRPBCC family protein [Ghiorsea sp.]|nr:SRPBCC family protein [Ghiorsea sp.]
MQFQSEIIMNTSASNIFEQYQNVERWHTWDHDVQSANLDGDFIEGTRGMLQPTHGPKSKFTLTEVSLNKSFTTKTNLPLCNLVFEHKLETTMTGTQVTHTVHFNGLLSPLFGRLIGSNIKKGLPNALKSLKTQCENNT